MSHSFKITPPSIRDIPFVDRVLTEKRERRTESARESIRGITSSLLRQSHKSFHEGMRDFNTILNKKEIIADLRASASVSALNIVSNTSDFSEKLDLISIGGLPDGKKADAVENGEDNKTFYDRVTAILGEDPTDFLMKHKDAEISNRDPLDWGKIY